MTTHATIDLETLSTKPDAVLLTIGAIKFDPFISDSFIVNFTTEQMLMNKLQ